MRELDEYGKWFWLELEAGCQEASGRAGHDLSEFYEGGLEKGGFSKLNLRKVRRRPGGGGATNIEGLRRGLKGGLRRGASQGGLEGGLEKGLEGGLEKGLQGGLEKGGTLNSRRELQGVSKPLTGASRGA